MGNHAVIHL